MGVGTVATRLCWILWIRWGGQGPADTGIHSAAITYVDHCGMSVLWLIQLDLHLSFRWLCHQCTHRLVTPEVLQRKRRRASAKKASLEKSKADAAEYHKLLLQRLKEQRERRSESLAKKRALRQASVASKEAAAK